MIKLLWMFDIVYRAACIEVSQQQTTESKSLSHVWDLELKIEKDIFLINWLFFKEDIPFSLSSCFDHNFRKTVASSQLLHYHFTNNVNVLWYFDWNRTFFQCLAYLYVTLNCYWISGSDIGSSLRMKWSVRN